MFHIYISVLIIIKVNAPINKLRYGETNSRHTGQILGKSSATSLVDAGGTSVL